MNKDKLMSEAAQLKENKLYKLETFLLYKKNYTNQAESQITISN